MRHSWMITTAATLPGAGAFAAAAARTILPIAVKTPHVPALRKGVHVPDSGRRPGYRVATGIM
jgi:hypothetical protein